MTFVSTGPPAPGSKGESAEQFTASLAGGLHHHLAGRVLPARFLDSSLLELWLSSSILQECDQLQETRGASVTLRSIVCLNVAVVPPSFLYTLFLVM